MRPRDVIELLLLSVLWGGAYLVTRAAVPTFGPAPLVAMGLGIAALMLLPIVEVRGGLPQLRTHPRALFMVGVPFTLAPELRTMIDPITAAPLRFLQIHIDAVRNSTDDFNLFHDPRKWDRIRGNPFGGPIVLGFQIECLVEDQLRLNRHQTGEAALIDGHRLRFSNYQFTFASVLKPGESVQVEIKKSQLRLGENATLSNRIAVKGEHGLVLFGFKKESQAPLFLSDVDLSHLPDLSHQPDRSYVDGTTLFYKRKFMSTGHAKNFLAGSLADQSAFFDELQERIEFPETYPAGLISCALLERARKNNHDFERNPMVYTAHNISVDRQLTRGLRSNDALHLLVDAPVTLASEKTDEIAQYVNHCYGVLQNGAVLFRASITMMPLAAIPKSA